MPRSDLPDRPDEWGFFERWEWIKKKADKEASPKAGEAARASPEQPAESPPEPPAVPPDQSSPKKAPERVAGKLSERLKKRPPAESARESANRPDLEQQAERVELAELLDRLPAPARRIIEHFLRQSGTTLHVERRRLLFNRLIHQETVDTDTHEVHVERTLAVVRKEPPPDLRNVIRHSLRAASGPGERPSEHHWQALQSTLPPRDELRLRWTSSDGEPHQVFISPEKIQLDDEDATPPAEADIPLTEPSGEIPVEGDPTPVVEQNEAEPNETLPEWVAAVVEEIWEQEERDTPQETPKATVEETAEIPAEAAAPSVEKAEVPEAPSLERVLEVLAEHIHTLTDLPPMAGGSPELDAVPEPAPRSPRRGPVIHNRPRYYQPPPDELVFMPVSHTGERLAVWEGHWQETREVPSSRLRRNARKLVRLLARRYGIPMTPELEVYLLKIALQPHQVGGRTVHSLGLNREALIGTLQVIWLNYGRQFPG